MRVELDHVFVCAAPDAPEAGRLIQAGFREAPRNQHPGQGTANRRFFFENAMIELLWVDNALEVQSQATRRTLLWERWSGRRSGACPFGICVRPSDPHDIEVPFPAWEYRPAYLPEPLVMHMADTGVDEPMWCYLNFAQRDQRRERFMEHPIGVREITDLTLISPAPLSSAAAHGMIESGILSCREGEEPLLEIELDRKRRNKSLDLRPQLPLVLQL